MISVLAAASLGAQTPSVTISIPANIPSEDVQISYFMQGKFGGVGGSIDRKPDLSAYIINGFSDSQQATRMKIIAYAPGCDFKTFDLSLRDNPYPFETFVCTSLPKVSLSGRFPAELIKGHEAEIVLSYQAYWAYGFFGISDGFVWTFDLAKVGPEQDGTFRIEFPDFSLSKAIADSENAALHLLLRDARTLNHLATSLTPEEPILKSHASSLKIQSWYPVDLRFVP